MELVSQAQLAKKIGKSRQYISELKQKGIFDKCFQGKKLVLDCALKAIESNIRDFKKTDPRQFKKLLNNEITQTIPKEIKNIPLKGKYIEELEKLLLEIDNPVQKAQLIKDFWQGKLLQVKYEKEREKYFTKEEVIEQFNLISKMVKKHFNPLPGQIAKKCYNKNISEIQDIIFYSLNNAFIKIQKENYEK